MSTAEQNLGDNAQTALKNDHVDKSFEPEDKGDNTQGSQHQTQPNTDTPAPLDASESAGGASAAPFGSPARSTVESLTTVTDDGDTVDAAALDPRGLLPGETPEEFKARTGKFLWEMEAPPVVSAKELEERRRREDQARREALRAAKEAEYKAEEDAAEKKVTGSFAEGHRRAMERAKRQAEAGAQGGKTSAGPQPRPPPVAVAGAAPGARGEERRLSRGATDGQISPTATTPGGLRRQRFGRIKSMTNWPQLDAEQLGVAPDDLADEAQDGAGAEVPRIREAP